MELLALIIIIIILFIYIYNLPSKGDQGETKSKLILERALDTNIYKIIHNVIIPSKNGTSQIDHLIISPYGLFIVETKNFKGWIFGNEKQPKWTQSLYGENFSFQNPLRQIYRQKKVISEYLEVEERFINTVINFVGECEFKTAFPNNVVKEAEELVNFILQFEKEVFSVLEINQILGKLDALQSNTFLTNNNHLQALHDRYDSQTICPKCGSNLVERIAKNGKNTGSRFLGCSNFPKCKYTRN